MLKDYIENKPTINTPKLKLRPFVKTDVQDLEG